jgi:thiol-disulfide isomerase/thioredoxin
MRRTILLLVAAAALLAAETAPRFTAKTMEGDRYTNETVKGKVVLLQFWATWCRYCRSDQSAVETITRQFADKGLVVLAVDVGESRKKVKQYLNDSPRSCKVVLNEDTNLPAIFAAKSYPLYVLIDREGNIAGTHRGAGGEDSLRRLLAKAGLE